MSKREVMHTRLGEMFDMLACHAIANGADPKNQAIYDYDDAINVR